MSFRVIIVPVKISTNNYIALRFCYSLYFLLVEDDDLNNIPVERTSTASTRTWLTFSWRQVIDIGQQLIEMTCGMPL